MRSECGGSWTPAFDFSKQREPLQGQDARPVLQEAPGPCGEAGLQRQEAGGWRQGGQLGGNEDPGKQIAVRMEGSV